MARNDPREMLQFENSGEGKWWIISVERKPLVNFWKKNWFKVLTLVLIAGIGVLTAVPVICACGFLKQTGASAKDLIEVDMMALMALLVTVWAGLNIANYFDKKEYENFQAKIEEDIKQKSDQFDEILDGRITDAKDEYERLNRDATNSLDLVKSEMRKNYQEQFLSALCTLLDVKTELVSAYFYDRYSETFPDLSAFQYGKLISVEHDFCQVFQLYQAKKYEKIEALVQKGLRLIEELRKENPDQLTKSYLLYREAGFYHYDGITRTHIVQRKGLLETACERYFKWSKESGITVVKYNGEQNPPAYKGGTNPDDKQYSAFLANALGEVYRLLLETVDEGSPEKKDYSRKAEFYYSCAAEWSDETIEREVYYRNYGFAIEKTRDGEDWLSKAKAQYTKAMRIGDLSEHLLHSVISVSDKIINVKMNISDFTKSERTPALGSEEYFRSIPALTETEKKDILAEMKELRDNASTACLLYSNKHDGYLYLAIYYRNQYILDKPAGNKDAAKWLTEAEDQIRIAELISRENIVVLAVKKDIEGLRKYDDQTKQQAAAEAAEPATV